MKVNDIPLFLIIFALLNLFLLACTSVSTESAMMKEDTEGIKMTSIELGIRLNEFGKYYAGKVEEAADEIISTTSQREVKMNALQWKINAIPRALESLVILDPRAAGIDIYALSGQMLYFFKEGNGKNLFGDCQYIAVNACQDIVDEIEKLAEDFRAKEYRAEGTKVLNEWIKDNPIENLQFNRRSTFEVMAKTLGAEEYDIGSTVGSIALGVHDIRRQITVYTEFLPKQTKWQAQLISYEVFSDSVIDNTFNNFDRIVKDADRIAKVAEETPSLIKDVQESSFAEINRQRILTLTTIANERAIIIDELKKEREIILENINEQRVNTLERIETLAETTVNQSSVVASDLIDKIFIRLLILLVIIIVGGYFILRRINKVS